MDEASKSLRMRRLLALALLLQWVGMIVGTTQVPHPPKYDPLTERLVSDAFFGLSLIPILAVFRRGGGLARTVALVLCLTLSVHIYRVFHQNGPSVLKLLHE
jgi:hypothetical protein